MRENSQKKVQAITLDKNKRDKALLARLPKPINTIRKEGNNALTELLEDCFSKIDDNLFELAKSALIQEDQDDYFSAMREIRGKRKTILKGFIDGINSAFCQLSIPAGDNGKASRFDNITIDDLAVVGYDDLDKLVAKEALAARATSSFEFKLKSLSERINSVVAAEVDHRTTPVSPDILCDLLTSSVSSVNISTKAMLVLFKLYEKSILDKLGPLYDLMNTLLKERGILPEIQKQKINKETLTPSHTRTVQDSSGGLHMPVERGLVETQLVHGHTEHTREPQTPALQTPTPQTPTPQTIGAQGNGQKNTFDLLAQLQLEGTSQPAINDHYLKHLLGEAQQKGASNIAITPKEKNIVAILDRLFSVIDGNVKMTSPVKSLFQKLQVPIAKVALTDQKFFSNPNHSARQLLNTISSAAIKCDSLGPERLNQDPLFNKMEEVVQSLVSNKSPSNQDFSNLLNELDTFSQKDTQRSDLFEKRLLSAEQGRAKIEKTNEIVSQTIEEAYQGLDIRAAVHNIIENGWKHVMTYIDLKHGHNSNQWDDAVEVLIDLITSTQTYVNKYDLDTAQDSLKHLRTKITEGLLSISYDAFKTENLIKQLERTFKDLANTKNTSQIPSQKPQESKSTERQEKYSPKITPIEQKQEPQIKPVISQTSYTQAKSLSRGAWFDIKENNITTRCRLAAIIEPHQKFIFVDRLGAKITDKTLEEIAAMLQGQSLIYLDSNHIFDNALEQVISNIKEHPQKGGKAG